MFEFKSHKLILLTGAGFTKNFGGFTGSEMWFQIFNDPEIQANKNLRDLLQDDFDFESAYSTIMTSELIEEKKIMQRVIEKVYKNLDDATSGWVFNNNSPYPVNWYGWCALTNLFNGTGELKGLFFTLNQDLFIERRNGHRPPGAPFFPHELYNGHCKNFTIDKFVTLPSDDAVTKAEEAFKNHFGLAYIKLHGSYGWKSSDGSNQMVIGKNKSELIEKEPLLKWYSELFKKVIYEGGKKMLIIGYGFGDEHINNILAKGVLDHGLKIYIISTKAPAILKKLFEVASVPEIFEGIRGYYPYQLKEIFPGNQEETIYFKQIKDALLRTD